MIGSPDWYAHLAQKYARQAREKADEAQKQHDIEEAKANHVNR